jgi:hypothetical protein
MYTIPEIIKIVLIPILISVISFKKNKVPYTIRFKMLLNIVIKFKTLNKDLP